MRHFFLATVLVFSCLAAVVGWAIHTGRVTVPPRWNPWAPLDIAAPTDWLTGFRLYRLSRDASLCSETLATSAMIYVGVPDETRDASGCGWHDAVKIRSLPTDVSAPFTLTCRSAVALAMWERHVVQPAAARHFGQPVSRLEHFGSYACRNVRGNGEGGRRSEHAAANALDVAGFRLQDGRRITVARSWRRNGGDDVTSASSRPDDSSRNDAEDTFLREVHHGACRYFTGVLGPEYNAAHRDHFHLDRGPFHVCR